MRVLITFGQCHVHSINGHTVDKDCVAAIKCQSPKEGRDLAFEWFDGKFHSSYVEGMEPKDLMDYYPRGKIEVN